MKIKRGSTSVRRLIFIADSSSTTGSGLASLAYNSAGLVAYYFAGDLSNEVQITLTTATLGTFASGGFVAVDNTNMPGWYEIGIPDAALDAGNEVAIQFHGAANMVPVNVYIELDAFNYQQATQSVTLAVTQPDYAPAKAGDAMALTPAERTTFAGVLEAAMLNEADGSALLAGMQSQLQAIFDQAGDVPVATLVNLIVSGVWSHATRTLSEISQVTVGGYAAGQDPATLLSGTVAKVTAIDGLLTALTEVVASVTRFRASALSQSPSSGGSGDAEQATSLDILETVESIAVALAGSTPVEPTGRIAQGGTVTAYIGDDFRVRSATQLQIPVTDPAAALKAKLDAIGHSNLSFGAAPKNGPVGAITGTISGITAAAGISTISIEITNCGADLMPGDVPYQIQQSQLHGSEYDDFVELEGTLRLKARAVTARG